jgi:hypothetical protein
MMRDNPPADTSGSPREGEQPAPTDRQLIGLFDLRSHSIEDAVNAAVDAMKKAGL